MTTMEVVAAGNTTPQTTTTAAPSGVARLRTQAAEASQVRALSTHPDVVALRVESVRTQVDRCMWVGIVLGLAFTMVNVQAFAAQGAVLWSLPWFAAWLLDPMVSLVLIGVLRAEQITARYQVPQISKWVRATKVFAFAATYAMNTWSSFLSKDIAGVVLHSVPPLLVFCAAETAPVLRDRLTEAVLRAERDAADANPTARPLAPETTPTPSPVLESDLASETTPAAPGRKPAARKAPARPTAKRGKTTGRVTGKDKARAHWDAEIAAGHEPTGGELARAAGVDASLGRRWRNEWKTETTNDTTGQDESDQDAAEITPAATTEPQNLVSPDLEGKAA